MPIPMPMLPMLPMPIPIPMPQAGAPCQGGSPQPKEPGGGAMPPGGGGPPHWFWTWPPFCPPCCPPCCPPFGMLAHRSTTSITSCFACLTLSGSPEMSTGQGSPAFVLTSILAPLSLCKRTMVSPPLPIILPTSVYASSKLSSTWPLPLPIPAASSFPSASACTICLALAICLAVPIRVTRHCSSPFSTETLAPLCTRTSAIVAPFGPMMRPVAIEGSSTCSVWVTEESSLLANSSSAKSFTISFAFSIWSFVPRNRTLHCSPAFSTDTRAPLWFRTC
mmetsp:Transcript_3718/g.5106  ORF Transcript_3718/g.5106 Transcript_3718/m.5106 type:complete len:278 (+) Transcript_3718:951-1784(+)